MNTRRDALKTMLFGAGYVGLRALATGLPASFFLNPRKALAAADAGAAACSSNMSAAQFFILSTSGGGDPINANAPGTYYNDTPAAKPIVHSSDPTMVPTQITIGGQKHYAAKVWEQLGATTNAQNWLNKTTFWHLATESIIHPQEPNVLRLMDATTGPEMLPSILGKLLQPCLNTIQAQPVCIGASTPSEALTFNGEAQPIIPPLSLKDTLTNTAGPLTKLKTIRDTTMVSIYDMYKNGTPAQKAYFNSILQSQQDVLEINQTLLGQLSNISDNSVPSQITAAITLIQMGISPVISIHIPFGGDNHSDTGLADETTQTNGTSTQFPAVNGVPGSGVPAIVALMNQLAKATFVSGALKGTSLSDKVTFMTLNVFGRTLVNNGGTGTSCENGRGHNENHEVSITIGNGFKAGVIGGIQAVNNDIGAANIDAATGASTGSSMPSGAISATNSLQAFGQTVLASVGISQAEITAQIPTGGIITGALAG
jgi:hypothetical protein